MPLIQPGPQKTSPSRFSLRSDSFRLLVRYPTAAPSRTQVQHLRNPNPIHTRALRVGKGELGRDIRPTSSEWIQFMADIETQSAETSTTETDSTQDKPISDRALEQSEQIKDVIGFGIGIIQGILFIVFLTPVVLLSMLLRRVLPPLGLIALVLGALFITGLWVVPGQLMDPVTHSEQVSATGNALLTFGGGGIAMIIVGGLLDDFIERYFSQKD